MASFRLPLSVEGSYSIIVVAPLTPPRPVFMDARLSQLGCPVNGCGGLFRSETGEISGSGGGLRGGWEDGQSLRPGQVRSPVVTDTVGWAAWSPSGTSRSFSPFSREGWLREHYSSLFVNLTSRHSASHQPPTLCHFDAGMPPLFDLGCSGLGLTASGFDAG